MIKFTSRDNGVTFAVRVQPRASRSGVAGELDGALKVRLASPPVDGEANDELVRVLAKLFDVSRAQIEIISGQTSKNKLVWVKGISAVLCEMALREALE
ncbi:MAG: DUF167 domain-containing protein [Acidobacteria bacterium]|nr:DUF167 domain-containing protein [Acidobacteriota bacterium]